MDEAAQRSIPERNTRPFQVRIVGHAASLRSPDPPRPDAGQSRLRLADVRVLEPRRVRQRLAPRAPGFAGRGRGRADDDRSHGRHGRRPHQPRGSGDLERPACGRPRADRALRAIAGQRRRHPARARRPERQHLGAVGRSASGRSPRGGRVAGRRAHGEPFSEATRGRGAVRRRHRRDRLGVCRRRRAARWPRVSTSSKSMRRTGISFTSSCRR